MKIVVTGATGFVGRHLVARLVKDGHAVTALVHRKASEGLFDDQVTVVSGSVDSPDSLERAFEGAEAVWHLVGIIAESRSATFETTVVQGTRNVVAASQKTDVKWLGYLSAMGTSAEAPSRYHQSKYQAEETIAGSGLEHVILRPSVIFGPGDGFVSMLTSMIQRAPIVPVIGDGKYRLQPVSIDDLTKAASASLGCREAIGDRIDIGGPEKLEYLEILNIMMGILGQRRPVMHMPVGLVKPVVAVMEKIIRPAPLTLDQLIMMQMGNTGDIGKMKELFGISPIGLADGLRKQLR